MRRGGAFSGSDSAPIRSPSEKVIEIHFVNFSDSYESASHLYHVIHVGKLEVAVRKAEQFQALKRSESDDGLGSNLRANVALHVKVPKSEE